VANHLNRRPAQCLDYCHEATSRLFEKGLNPVEVATITGHKDTKMLMRYTHLRAEDLVDGATDFILIGRQKLRYVSGNEYCSKIKAIMRSWYVTK
jgi:hypothetical protein